MPKDKSYVAISLAVDLVLELMKHGIEIQRMIQAAQHEGRDHLTLEEWSTILKSADQADSRLSKAIAQAKAKGQ